MFSVLEFKIPLGRWLGIPVGLHWSWVLLMLLVLGFSPAYALIYAAVFALVLLHEFGHCLAGRYYNMQVKSITLYPMGGVAHMQIPEHPKEEIVVALAGPAVNFFLIPLFWMLSPLHATLATISTVNMFLLVFNLIPAFPMDGGRVVRALFVYGYKDYARATEVAGRIGQVFGVLFVILAFLTGNVMLAVIGIFVALAAQGEIENARYVKRRNAVLKRLDALSSVERSGQAITEIQRKIAAVEERWGNSP